MLAESPIPLPLQFKMLPEDLHLPALQAAVPGIAAASSVAIPYSWSVQDCSAPLWTVLGTQTHLLKLDCSCHLDLFDELYKYKRSPVPDSFLQCVENLPHLVSIDISGLMLKEFQVSQLLGTLRPSVLELNLSGQLEIDPGSAAHLRKFTALQTLVIDWSTVRHAALPVLGKSISRLPNLRVLDLKLFRSPQKKQWAGFCRDVALCTTLHDLTWYVRTRCDSDSEEEEGGEEEEDYLMCNLPPCLERLHTDMHIHGNVASRVATLTNLRELHFTGVSVGDYNAALGLNVSVDSPTFASFASQCTSMSSLRVLEITEGDISSVGADALARLMPHLLCLQTLRIDTLMADPPVGPSLPSSLSKVSQLLHISLRGFQFDLDCAQALGDSLKVLTGLLTLDLNGTYLGDEGVLALAPHIEHLAELQTLGLRECEFECEGLQALANQVGNLPALQSLSFDSNGGDEACFRTLASQFSTLKRLTELTLASQQMEGTAADTIFKHLGCLTGLEKLDLQCSELTSSDAASLGPILRHLDELRYIDLSNNELGGDGIKSIVRGIRPLRKLQYLNVENASIDDSGLEVLVECVQVMPSLNFVRLACNDIRNTHVGTKNNPFLKSVLFGIEVQKDQVMELAS